jgi:hypothetical protein
VELDGSLDVSRQELSRMRSHGEEEEERWRGREQELLVRLEDSRGRERKLEDQKHNLEVCLADATQQIQELKVPYHASLNLSDESISTRHYGVMVRASASHLKPSRSVP